MKRRHRGTSVTARALTQLGRRTQRRFLTSCCSPLATFRAPFPPIRSDVWKYADMGAKPNTVELGPGTGMTFHGRDLMVELRETHRARCAR